MSDIHGASPSGDRAAGPSDLSRASASSQSSIPSAGDWIVGSSVGYGTYMFHSVGVVDSVKPKTVWAKIDGSRRVSRFSYENVIVAVDEKHARRICAQLESAKAEAYRRERAAQAFYKEAIGRIAASAIEAATAGETREAGLDPKDESAVPQADAQPLSTGPSHDH